MELGGGGQSPGGQPPMSDPGERGLNGTRRSTFNSGELQVGKLAKQTRQKKKVKQQRLSRQCKGKAQEWAFDRQVDRGMPPPSVTTTVHRRHGPGAPSN
jgi:hypothetical protein